MKNILILVLLIVIGGYSEPNFQRFDNFDIALRYLYNGQFFESFYEFNFVITRFPNFHLNHKSNFYAATCLRYFGQNEESIKYLDSSDAFTGIQRDNNQNPFIWLARSDSAKALLCFKNIENYPYNYILSFPYLFQAQLKNFPEDIMEQMISQKKRMNMFKSLVAFFLWT